MLGEIRLIKVFIAIVVSLLATGGQFSSADDSTLTPINEVPKLSESYELVNYKQVFAAGTLMPDKVGWDTVVIRTGLSEAKLVGYLPECRESLETKEQRTRQQQWQFIQELLFSSNFSMNYYILSPIYYDQQLYGWFKQCERRIDGVGNLRVYLHAEKPQDNYRIWLLELVLEPVAQEKVEYKQGPGLVLERTGKTKLEWDVDSNCVTIGGSK